MKAQQKRLKFKDIDPGFDVAVSELAALCRHVPHGRLFLVLERDLDITTGHKLSRDPFTSGDVAGIMRTPPGGSE